ncbi:ATP-binding protein [Streptomyces sp. NPDC001514]
MRTAHPALEPGAAPESAASWPLCPEHLSAAQARRLAAGQLAEWGLDGLIDTAQLLISEMVTNAVRHAPGPIRLSLRRYPTALRCDVEDASPKIPQPRAAGDEAESGRGLVLLDALTNAWGSQRTPVGKSIWFELLLPRGAHPCMGNV